MSAADLARVLAFALVDEAFGRYLAESPGDALASVSALLSDEEREALDDFSVTDFRAATAILSGASSPT